MQKSLNYKRTTVFLVTALHIYMQGCSIDPPIASDCSAPTDQVIISYPVDKPFRNAPFANPLLVNEFGYISAHDGIEGIWKFNLVTNTKELILETDIQSPPDWNINNWIVFGNNAQIFICKSNGDSLKQVTFNGLNYYPRWSPDGNMILFEKNDGDAIQNYSLIDMDGSLVNEFKSTSYAGKMPCFSPDGQKIAFISTSNIYDEYVVAYFYMNDPLNIIYLPSTTIQKRAILGPLNCYPDSKSILFNINDDIYQINIETGKTTLVVEGVDCIDYSYHTILADGNTIVTVRQESSYNAESNTEYYDYDLIKLFQNGGREVIPY